MMSIEIKELSKEQWMLLINGNIHSFPWHKEEAEKRLIPLINNAFGSILEIGLGRGITARIIDDSGRFQEHIIVEKYPEIIEQYGNGFNVVCSDWRDYLPSCGRRFDYILFDAETMTDEIMNELKKYSDNIIYLYE